MRSDYALYAVAIVFFVLTGVVAAYSIEQQQLWIVATAVLGLAALGIGYMQRPRHETYTATTALSTNPATPTAITSLTPSAPESSAPTPAVLAESSKPAVEPLITEEVPGRTAVTSEATTVVQTSTLDLTRVRGIGPKRMEQLKAFGISSIGDLAKASEEDVARKLKISPKITRKWIESAKEIGENS